MNIQFSGVYKTRFVDANGKTLSPRAKEKAVYWLPDYRKEALISLKDGTHLLVANDEKGKDCSAYRFAKFDIDMMTVEPRRLDAGGVKDVLNAVSKGLSVVVNGLSLAYLRQFIAQKKLHASLQSKAAESPSLKVTVTPAPGKSSVEEGVPLLTREWEK